MKSDLRAHGREIEGLLQRVAALEGNEIAPESSSDNYDTSDISDLKSLIVSLSIRLDDIEASLNDVSTIGPKKLAIKFGARMDALDERLQSIEARSG